MLNGAPAARLTGLILSPFVFVNFLNERRTCDKADTHISWRCCQFEYDGTRRYFLKWKCQAIRVHYIWTFLSYKFLRLSALSVDSRQLDTAQLGKVPHTSVEDHLDVDRESACIQRGLTKIGISSARGAYHVGVQSSSIQYYWVVLLPR